jgi:ABC-type branched-subunit amino acid transport system substrate-binding protein
MFIILISTSFAQLEAAEEIVFGQSAFLSSGALQLYGELIRNSINARFNRINDTGGINGKKVRLVSMDDGGEPSKTAQNVETMRQQNIDMFFGNMGTRSIFRLLPLVENKKIALLFPWGGADELRQPKFSHLINGLGFVKPQIEAIVNHILENLRIRTKIAVFHDDSSFGIANKKLLNEALGQFATSPAAIASYNRFTMDVASPTKDLIKSDPKVVVCLSTSMPAVKLIDKFLEGGHYGTKFIGIDSTMFVGKILKRRGIPFSYTSPMPDPEKSNLPIVKQFRQDMKKYAPKDPINILSLAYYIHAAIIEEALKKIVGQITKEKLIAEIESMKNYNIGGFTVDFDKQSRHAYPHNISILTGS